MPNVVEIDIFGHRLSFETENELFSPHGLDAGTCAMLSHVEITPTDKVLDLGCGYGVVGIAAALRTRPDLVYLIDSDERAVSCARLNARNNGVPGVHVVLSQGFTNISETGFTLILCNPPYHVDFSVPKHFIEKGFNRLAVGGSMYMVTKRKGWYQEKLKAIFGAAQIWEDNGYFVFRATKTSATYASKSKLDRRGTAARPKRVDRVKA
jgi:16S rRNA (guanine1207-N2)-methyltransferase